MPTVDGGLSDLSLLTSGCSSFSLPNMAQSIQNEAAFQKTTEGVLSCSLTDFQTTCGQGSHVKVRPSAILGFLFLFLPLDSLMRARLLVLWGKYRSHDYQQLTNSFETSFDMAYVQLHLGLWLLCAVECVCLGSITPTIINQKRLVAFGSCWAPHFEEWIGTQCEH